MVQFVDITIPGLVHRHVAFVGFVGAAAIGCALIAPSVILWAIGFTTAGVAAGSAAAAWQSTIGNVAAGSWFSWLQSIGEKQ